MSGGLGIAVDHHIPLVTKASRVISIVGVSGVRGGSRLCCRLGITGGTRVITTVESNGSARGDEKSRTDSILPLKTEAPTRRKVLFWKVTGDVLAAVHASLKAVLDLKATGREVA
jgi:hypothetical protein